MQLLHQLQLLQLLAQRERGREGQRRRHVQRRLLVLACSGCHWRRVPHRARGVARGGEKVVREGLEKVHERARRADDGVVNDHKVDEDAPCQVLHLHCRVEAAHEVLQHAAKHGRAAHEPHAARRALGHIAEHAEQRARQIEQLRRLVTRVHHRRKARRGERVEQDGEAAAVDQALAVDGAAVGDVPQRGVAQGLHVAIVDGAPDDRDKLLNRVERTNGNLVPQRQRRQPNHQVRDVRQTTRVVHGVEQRRGRHERARDALGEALQLARVVEQAQRHARVLLQLRVARVLVHRVQYPDENLVTHARRQLVRAVAQ
eukprot:Unigene596_Nuclearia_a/m.1922 Unigene596_Nuclearia_a/g.1922  ORF Unigene596_Nuclearia_a/g.1922 Unigene596_Nuclearia_a/m.1922 type:complete len:315 (-) Unigene596_Nuclearia_a:1237-2181(-)